MLVVTAVRVSPCVAVPAIVTDPEGASLIASITVPRVNVSAEKAVVPALVDTSMLAPTAVVMS